MNFLCGLSSLSKSVSPLDLTLVLDHMAATTHLHDVSLWKARRRLTTSAAVISVQSPGALQPDVLIGGGISTAQDTSTQPGLGGTEAEERRKGTADSLLLPEYSGKEQKWPGKL